MRTSRPQYIITVGVVATTGLVLLLALRAVSTGAATGKYGEASGTLVPREVLIACEGRARFGPPGAAHGDCRISGAITDRGRFFDSAPLRVHPHLRTLALRRGTIELSVYRERRGHWRIVGGTRAYVGLRGRGREWRSHPCPGCAVTLKLTGTVSHPNATGP